jgi:hypothetical protein
LLCRTLVMIDPYLQVCRKSSTPSPEGPIRV